MTRAAKITKYVQVVLLIGLAILMLSWSFVEILVPSLNIKQVASIMMAILAAAFLYFDDRLSQIIEGPKGMISHGKLSECLERAVHGHQYINHLRVYATSSEMIQPILAGREVHIGKCILLLREYSERDTPASANYNRRVEDIINEWRHLKSEGYIKELEIARFKTVPSIYQVIFDERAMLIGNYYLRHDVSSGLEYLPPSLIQSVSHEGHEMIAKSIKAFDLNFKGWSEQATVTSAKESG